MTKNMSRLAVAVMATGAVATAAYAATPEEGQVSTAAPEVTWTGTVTSSGAWHDAWAEDPSVPCPQASQCDPFALKVAEGGRDVAIKVNLDGTALQGNNGSAGIRVEKPDGSYAYISGESGQDADLILTLEKAAAGDYTVHTVASYYCCGSTDYNALARMNVPAPAEQPAPQSQPAPQPQSQPQPQPQSQPQPQPAAAQTSDFALTAKAPKVSARKTRKSRRFSVPVTTSRAIQKLVLTLKKGKKTLGTATVSPFSGKGSVALRSKSRLKKGTYDLVVVGTDQGVTVGRTLKLKVSR